MATTTVCPFCFRKIDPARLWYQCLGRGNTECKKEVDPAREKLTKSHAGRRFRALPRPRGSAGRPTAPPAAAGPTGGRARSATPRCRPTSWTPRAR